MAGNDSQLNMQFDITSIVPGGSSAPPATHERPAWEPFLMPNMDPLVRQQGLLFEQSELLREQFVRFGEGLQRVHSMTERLRDDLDIERSQRLHGEEQVNSGVASLRADALGDRKKHELMLKQVDERLIGLREEVVLRARASDSELQRLGSRTDGLAMEVSTQLTSMSEKQKTAIDEVQADLQNTIVGMRASLEASLVRVRSELVDGLASKNELREEVQKCEEAFTNLERRIQEDCIEGLRRESDQRQSSHDAHRELAKNDHDALAVTLTSVRQAVESLQVAVGLETRQQGANFEAVMRRIDENYEHCLSSIRDEENRRLAGQEALATTAQEHMTILTEKLLAAEATLTENVSGLHTEMGCEVERFAANVSAWNASSTQLHSELLAERRERSAVTVGLMTEVSEVRCEISQGSELHQENSMDLDLLKQRTLSLERSLQESETAHADLSQAFNKQTQELHLQTNEMQSSLTASISDGWQSVTDSARLGREELWHVLGSLQERTALTTEEVQEMSVHTKRLEVDHLGRFSSQLEEFASVNDHLAGKYDTLEKCSIREQATLATRLDNYFHDLERTRHIVDGLVDISSRDFLESRNAQFRLYLTSDGDIAMFQRGSWGKWVGNEFQGIPAWHAGCQPILDRPMCSVNREMQAHEKDRFLALANRAATLQQ